MGGMPTGGWRVLWQEARTRDLIADAREYFRETIWERDAPERGRLHSITRRLCRVAYVFVHGSLDRHVLTSASALTFHTLLSMVPLLAVAFSLAKGLGFKTTAVQNLLVKATAGQTEIAQRIVSYVENTGVAALGAVGALFLIWTAISVIGRIEKAFNQIWGVSQGRSLRRKITDYLAVVLIFPFLLIFASTVTGTLQSNAFLARFLEAPGVVRMIPVLMLWAAFTFVFVFLTHTKVELRAAIIGGGVTAIIWHLAQWGYISFQVGVSKYNAIYGTFAALPIFLVWLNLSWMVVLLGNEVAYAVQHESSYHPAPPTGYRLSIARREQLALHFVAEVWKRFEDGARPLATGDLVAEVDVPRVEALRVLETLVDAGLLARASEPEDGLLPARDLGKATVGQVLHQFRHCGDGGDPAQVAELLDRRFADAYLELDGSVERSAAEPIASTR